MSDFKELHQRVAAAIIANDAVPKKPPIASQARITDDDINLIHTLNFEHKARLLEVLSSGFSGQITKTEHSELAKIINKTISSQEWKNNKLRMIQALNSRLEAKPIRSPFEDLAQSLKSSTDSGRSEQLLELLRTSAVTAVAGYGSNPDVSEMARKYQGQFDPDEYKKLLIYCKAADIYEQKNAVPEEQALKLAVVFKTAKNAFEFIDTYKTSTKPNSTSDRSDEPFVHDACLFTLPDPQVNWGYWTRLISENKHLMVSEVFRNIFANAKVIEEHYPTFKILAAPTHSEQQIRADLQNARQKLVKLKALSGNASERMVQETTIATKLQELAILSAHKGVPFETLDINAINGCYSLYQQQTMAAMASLINLGLPAPKRAKFAALDRTHAGQNIPELFIDGASIGYPEFHFRKLIVQSDSDAALGACLGKLTRCCQSLDGVGHECAEHGLTNPNGGFYVLFKGDDVIGQSWTWRGTNGELVFDSIEAPNVDKDMIEKFYKTAAMRLATVHGITTIALGTSGGTRRGYSLGQPFGPSILPINYYGHRDSEGQTILTDRLAPYLLIDPSNENKILKEQATKVLEESLLKADDQSKRMIRILMQHLTSGQFASNIELSKQYLREVYFNSSTIEPSLSSALEQKLILTHQLYSEISKKKGSDPDIVLDLIKQGASLDLRVLTIFDSSNSSASKSQMQAIYREIKNDLPNLLETSRDIKDASLILQKLDNLYTMIEPKLPLMLNTMTDLSNILQCLEDDEHEIFDPVNEKKLDSIFELVKDKLPKSIRFGMDCSVFKYFNPSQKKYVYEQLKLQIPNIILNMSDLAMTYYVFDEYKDEIFQKTLPILPTIIKSRKDFDLLYNLLPPNQLAEVLPSLIKSKGYSLLWSKLSNYHELLDPRNHVLDQTKTEIMKQLKNPSDLGELLNNYKEDNELIMKVLTPHIILLIKSREDIEFVLQKLDVDFPSEGKENIEKKLTSIVPQPKSAPVLFQYGREEPETEKPHEIEKPPGPRL